MREKAGWLGMIGAVIGLIAAYVCVLVFMTVPVV